MYSLTNHAVPWLLAAALTAAAGSAAGQQRTPTNPLDVPEPQQREEPAPVIIPAPVPPPVLVPVPLPGQLAVPGPPGEAPPPLEDLLPAGSRQRGGLSEAQVIARARTTARSARIAAAQQRAAESGVLAAKLAFMPNVTLSARYTRLSDITPGTIGVFNTPGCLQDLAACQANPGAFQQQVVLQEPILNQYSFVASARWNLTDLIGSRRLDLEAAEAEADAARAATRSAEQDVVVEAVIAYWDVVRARAQATLAADSAKLAEKHVREARARREQGLSTEVAVLQAIGNERGYARLVQVANNRVALAESALRRLLDMPPDQAIALDARLEALPQMPRQSVRAMTRKAIERSSDLAAARARAAAAGARASSREARLYPSLTAGFNLNYDNPNTRIFPQEEKFTATWDASVVLSWSLDNTAVGVAQLDQLRELEEAERLAAEQTERAIEQGIIAARGDLEAALLGVQSAQYAAGSSRAAAQQTRERFAAGLATATEMMNSEAQYLSARLDLVDALVDARVAHAQLQRALGQSLESGKGE